MESSEGGGMGGVCSVGTIVWVRRRNGSWWPGRILGLHELSASHLMSPRSGTPVKLLGREDASVDWYNLEKSKRVKEFRCGEFDAFIERAETSQSIPTRKREKYARREDAILHALELEKQQKLDYTLNGISSKINGGPKSESVILSSPENFVRHNEPVVHGKLSSRKYESFLKNVVLSHDGKDIDDPLYLYEGIGNKKISLEHNAEAVRRMRGLQDFGRRTSQSKRKPSLSTGWENTHKSIDNHIESFSRSDNIIEEADQPSTSGNVVSFKRKRSCGGAINEFFVKKRDRRRPLVQVLLSSEKLPPPCSLQPSCGAIGTLNTQESEKAGSTWKAKRSRCVYLRENLEEQPDHVGYISEYVQESANQFEICNDVSYSGKICEGYNSSCLIEMNDNDHCNGELSEPNMLEETDMLTDTIDILLPGSKDCDPPDLQVTGEIRSLMQEDAPLSSFMLQLNGQAKNPSFDNGVSDWRLKGKRNIRNLGKRLVNAVDIKKCGPDVERSNGSINSTYDVKESALPIEREQTSGQRILKPGLYPIKKEFEHAYDECNLMDKDLNQSQLTVYVDEKSLDLVRVDPQLVDVDLKVQPSHQDEHVPLVSLMSKLNGTAIVGYPIQIEILEDGSTNHHSAVIDEATAPQPMWWTARRTAMHRVPRLIPSTSALDKGEDPNLFRHSLHKKACYRYLNHRVRGPTTKFPKKNVKRISLSNRKTRKLSSLASNEKLASDKLTRCDVVLGDSVPRVTCVPVKVVFSRILEAIGRPSSGFARRVRTRSQET